jgi:pyruvate/2-oxoglutarate dehydrogenase complex dihydrolipoamide dehydrogenase (E3) component
LEKKVNDAKTYDVIVLGGGRGGMNLVVQLAAAGKKVLLVEKDRAMIGGSCINIACIPTKAFIACARRLAQCKGAKAFGIS